jgi:hypothetical protein
MMTRRQTTFGILSATAVTTAGTTAQQSMFDMNANNFRTSSELGRLRTSNTPVARTWLPSLTFINTSMTGERLFRW